MDTTELGGGSYPTPLEPKEQLRNITIKLKIQTKESFYTNWSDEYIKEYIRDNIQDYIKFCDIEIEDIEV